MSGHDQREAPIAISAMLLIHGSTTARVVRSPTLNPHSRGVPGLGLCGQRSRGAPMRRVPERRRDRRVWFDEIAGVEGKGMRAAVFDRCVEFFGDGPMLWSYERDAARWGQPHRPSRGCRQDCAARPRPAGGGATPSMSSIPAASSPTRSPVTDASRRYAMRISYRRRQ